MEGINKNTFKQIFHEYWDEFKQANPRFDNSDYDENIQKMLGCGDPNKMGFVQYWGAKQMADTWFANYAACSCFISYISSYTTGLT